MPLRFVSAAFLAIVAVAVAECAQIVGVLLVFTLMVGPAAAAQNFTRRLAAGVALSAALALAEAWGGLTLAFYTDWPTSFWITALSGMVFFARRRQAIRGVGGRPRPSRMRASEQCRLRPFLDVEALGARPAVAARGSTRAGEARALAIAQVGGRDELLARVLAGRGVAPDGGRALSRSDACAT